MYSVGSLDLYNQSVEIERKGHRVKGNKESVYSWMHGLKLNSEPWIGQNNKK